MEAIRRFKVNKSDTSKGINVPSGFVVNVCSAVLFRDVERVLAEKAKKTDPDVYVDEFNNYLGVSCLVIADGDASETHIPCDKLLEKGLVNGNQKRYKIIDTNVSLNKMIDDNLLADIKAAYGASNVEEI